MAFKTEKEIQEELFKKEARKLLIRKIKEEVLPIVYGVLIFISITIIAIASGVVF